MTATDAAFTEAWRRARRLYPSSKGFQRVYVKGYLAATAGRDSRACPYPDDPKKTWRRAWRIAWMRGHLSHAPNTEEIG